jgi:ankyrin repeat protein
MAQVDEMLAQWKELMQDIDANPTPTIDPNDWHERMYFAKKESHSIRIAREGLRDGEDINRVDLLGHTALDVAVLRKEENLVRLLLDEGADVMERSRRCVGDHMHSITKLATCASLRVLPILLEHGAPLYEDLFQDAVHELTVSSGFVYPDLSAVTAMQYVRRMLHQGMSTNCVDSPSHPVGKKT